MSREREVRGESGVKELKRKRGQGSERSRVREGRGESEDIEVKSKRGQG